MGKSIGSSVPRTADPKAISQSFKASWKKFKVWKERSNDKFESDRRLSPESDCESISDVSYKDLIY